jgi:hypothetical protein
MPLTYTRKSRGSGKVSFKPNTPNSRDTKRSKPLTSSPLPGLSRTIIARTITKKNTDKLAQLNRKIGQLSSQLMMTRKKIDLENINNETRDKAKAMAKNLSARLEEAQFKRKSFRNSPIKINNIEKYLSDSNVNNNESNTTEILNAEEAPPSGGKRRTKRRRHNKKRHTKRRH